MIKTIGPHSFITLSEALKVAGKMLDLVFFTTEMLHVNLQANGLICKISSFAHRGLGIQEQTFLIFSLKINQDFIGETPCS